REMVFPPRWNLPVTRASRYWSRSTPKAWPISGAAASNRPMARLRAFVSSSANAGEAERARAARRAKTKRIRLHASTDVFSARRARCGGVTRLKMHQDSHKPATFFPDRHSVAPRRGGERIRCPACDRSLLNLSLTFSFPRAAKRVEAAQDLQG